MNMIRTAGTFKNIAVVAAIFVITMFGPAFGQEATHELLTDSMPELRQGSQWILSKDAEHIGFIGEIGDKQQSFFFDGKATGQYFSVSWMESHAWWPPNLVMADLVCCATKDNKCCLLVNGVEGTWYEDVGSVGYGKGFKFLAYVAGLGEGQASSWWVVFQGKDGPIHSYPLQFRGRGPMISRSGDRYAYTVEDCKESQFFYVLNGQPLGRHKRVVDFCFSPDGKHTAYTADDGDGWYVVVNEKAVSEENLSIDNLYVHNDGLISYIGTTVGQSKLPDSYRSSVFFKGEVVAECGLAKNLVISPDEKHYYCILSSIAPLANGVEVELLIDGVRHKAQHSISGYFGNKAWDKAACILSGNGYCYAAVYDKSGELYRSPRYSSSRLMRGKFNPANDKLATWGIRDGGWCVDYDDKEYGPFRRSWMSGFIFSKDGSRFGFYTYGDGDSDVVIDGQIVGTYKEVRDLQFSDDGKRAVYLAKVNDKTWIVVLNGKQLGEYDRVSVLFFKPDGTLIYYAQKDKNLYRVTCKADAATPGGSSASQPTATSDPVSGNNSTRPASQPTSGPKIDGGLDDKK